MGSKLCAPYEGDRPYLYISYHPKDMDIILPILRVLQDKGYRIGYDNSNAPGSEWSGIVARCLDQSTVFLAFISPNWIASQKCLEEFAFAQMKRQPSLAVILDSVQLTPMMKIQLASIPAIDCSECTPKEFQSKLLERLDKLDPALRQDPEPAPSASRGKRPLLIAAVAVLILMAGIAVVLLARGGAGAMTDAPKETAASAEPVAGPSPSPEPELDHSAAYHIFLTAPEDMPQDGFAEALSTIRGRLDSLTGGEPYELSVAGDSVELYLPKSAFAAVDVETVLKSFIASAAKLYIFDLFSSNTARESIRRDDLSSVTLSHGTIPGVDAAQFGIESPDYDYLTIQLTDQCAAWFGKEIAEWDNALFFGQDMESGSNCVHYYTVSAGDGKTFYILNTDLGDQILELLLYNLTHSPLPDNFLFTIDLNSLAVWQSAEGGSRMGENQCDPAALEDETVTFILGDCDLPTAEDRLNAERELKARLDLLDQPYAFGRIENEDTAVFAVRTGMNHMGLPIIDLIGGSDVRLQANYYSIYFSKCSFVWETTSDGICLLALEVRSNVTDSLKKLTSEMTGQDNALYLTIGGIPVLRSSVEQLVSDGRIIFDRLCVGPETGIMEEYRWLTALMERTINDSSLVPQFHLARQIQMNLGDKVIDYDESRFGMSYVRAEQAFADAVYAIAPDAVIMNDLNPGQVYVYLNFELNEDFPERAASLAQEIYEVSGFEQSIFQNLTIYLIDEDTSVSEHARIVFQKTCTSVFPPSNPLSTFPRGTYVSGTFQGERLKQYQTEFQHIVETDPFYISLTLKGRTSWTW